MESHGNASISWIGRHLRDAKKMDEEKESELAICQVGYPPSKVPLMLVSGRRASRSSRTTSVRLRRAGSVRTNCRM